MNSGFKSRGRLVHFYWVRLSVRTVGFQPTKTGSIPVPSTKFMP